MPTRSLTAILGPTKLKQRGDGVEASGERPIDADPDADTKPERLQGQCNPKELSVFSKLNVERQRPKRRSTLHDTPGDSESATKGSELRIENLTVRYGSAEPVVRDLSLTVAPGELFVLLGPSGCGKTTTMRCIAGLEQASTGRITVGGDVVVDTARRVSVPAHKRDVGMMFQSYAIWPHMTVLENVGYSLAIRHVPRAAMRERVVELLDLVGLSGMADRRATQLSGGQMQRVALARSLATQPRALLLDEPLSNLDSKLRERLRFELREIQQRFHLTSVYVTHDREEALALADRIGIMKDGDLVQVASPTELYERPRTTYAASFMGMDTACAGTILEADADAHASIVQLVDGERLRVENNDVPPGTPVHVCARSTDIELLGPGSGAAWDNVVETTVISANYRGDRVRYHLAVPCGDEVYADTRAVGIAHERGDAVHVRLPADRIVALAE